jgi:ATP-dependent Clp protease ATP-binding subunit ClpC
MKNRVQDELKRVFRPEFLNRVDETIVFHPLNEEEILLIVDLMLTRIRKQLAQQGMTIEISQAAKELLAKEGYDPTYGARPLRRAIQRLIEDPLSEEVLLGHFVTGDTIRLDANNEDKRIAFSKAAPLGLDSEPASASNDLDGGDKAETVVV